MPSASTRFQPDRDGSPGFQLAEDAGFQTQGAVAPLSPLEVVLALDAVTSQYSPRHALVGDLQTVVTLDAITRGPRVPLNGGGAWARRTLCRLPRRAK